MGLVNNWITIKTLYNKGGTHIFQTTYSKWVLKVNDNPTQAAYEIRVILDLFFAKPRHAVELHPQLTDLYGNGWYALRRYDGHVELDDFCREHWKTIAVHVLQFLQDFHHELGLVHMDIKKGNIFVDRTSKQFVVGDYENSTQPCAKTTMVKYTDDEKWYYMSLGAEFDKPLMSWRFDLAALGYVLASLTVKPDTWTFENECWERRLGRGSTQAPNEVVALRAKELAAAAPAVVAYMERVGTLAWDLKEPPPRSFYEELEMLFT